MEEYISRQAARRAIEHYDPAFCSVIDGVPAANVVPAEEETHLELWELEAEGGNWVWVVSEDPNLTVRAWAYVGEEAAYTFWEYRPNKLIGTVTLWFGDYGKEWIAYRTRQPDT